MLITRRLTRDLCARLLRSIAAFCLLVLAMLHGGVSLGQTLYFHNDVLGNPVVATDAYGSVAWKQRYRPYGEPTVSAPVSAGENRLWFSGKPYDAANQLSYFGARYYEPASGRFFGIDPKEAEAADLHSINRYAYGNNNPLRYQDPNGLWAEEAVGGISLAISAHEFYRSPSLFNAAILATDAILVAVPGIPAFAGATVHGTKGVSGLTKALDASGAAAKALPDSALVCRGGACKAESFSSGSGVTRSVDGTLSGVSTQSRAGASLEELAKPFPHNQVGVTTVGEIRRAGGRVMPDGSPRNPNHATVDGLTPQQLERLFTPTQPNPVPIGQRGL
jgi:RHS repeat-associated protein